MDELSAALLDKLIEKTFEGMGTEEKLNFIERIFADLDSEGKERFLRRMVQGPSPDSIGEAKPTVARPGPPMMSWGRRGRALHEFGPWQRCCRMMMAVSEAPRYDSARATDAARIFEALANETRIKIVKLLQEGEMHVEDLTQTLGLAQSTVSHHLRVLKDAGLIRAEKRGRSMYYSIVPSTALDSESSQKQQQDRGVD